MHERAGGQPHRWHTDGICHAICRVAEDIHMDYDSAFIISAEDTLRPHKPEAAKPYWFPVRKDTYTQEECVEPRRVILNRIIASL